MLVIVKRILSVWGDPEKHSVTLGWWNKFSKRHPELAWRTPSILSLSRANASTKECIHNYFDVLDVVLSENDLHDQPSLNF